MAVVFQLSNLVPLEKNNQGSMLCSRDMSEIEE